MSGGRVVGRAYLLRDRREIVSLQRQLVVSARLAAVGDLSKSISASINEPVAMIRDEFEGLALDWATTRDLLELANLEDECREAVDAGEELIDECIEGVDRIFSIVREVAGFSTESEREEFVPHSLDQIVRRALRIAEVQAVELPRAPLGAS
jgi:C4-dicarboxylate-specific signal transduction histidine kinase